MLKTAKKKKTRKKHNMGLSKDVLQSLISDKTRQLTNAPAKGRQQAPIANGDFRSDANTARGDAYLASLGFDNYDEQPKSVARPKYQEENDEYAPRKLSEAELQREMAIAVNPTAINNSRMPGAIKNMVAESMNREASMPKITERFTNDEAETMREIMRRSDELTTGKDGKVQQRTREGGGSVDYSIIKAIINECLNERLQDSGTLTSIGLKAGKITLVDNKGNVYQAKLEKIGNKNDKKESD